MGDCISNRMAQARRFRRRDHCVDSGGNPGHQICRGSDALCAADAAENLEQSLCVCCRCGGHGAQPFDMRGDQNGYAQALSRGDHGIGGTDIIARAVHKRGTAPAALRMAAPEESHRNGSNAKSGGAGFENDRAAARMFPNKQEKPHPFPASLRRSARPIPCAWPKKRNPFAREAGWRPPGQGNVSMDRTVIGEPMRV